MKPDQITAEQLRRATGCSERLATLFVEPLRITFDRFGIDTAPRRAAFLAQVAHESARFARLTENLNYSALALSRTWPTRFRGDDGQPNPLARRLKNRPSSIANEVYSARLGNGDAETGDGWRYRGRGLIQITGRNNYRDCGEALRVDLLADPDVLTSPLYASLSAGWYWDARRLNVFADRGDVEGLTRAINGGLNGISDRIALFNAAQRVLA